MSTYTLDQLRRDGTESLMQWLLPLARHLGTLTYGEVASRLEKKLGIPFVFPTHIGSVAGNLADTLLEYDEDIPLLNVLVVATDGFPGKGIDGYFKDRYGKFTPKQRPKICAKAAQEVYRFHDWDDVYREIFRKKPPKDDAIELSGAEADGKSPDGRHAGEPESPAHKRLKHYVHDHPSAIGLSKNFDLSDTEFSLLSGDEVDVCFIGRASIALVEVKSRRSNFSDLRRGIYQCVKYRAVMDAQRDQLAVPIRAILVTEDELPGELLALARRLRVRVKNVRVPASYGK